MKNKAFMLIAMLVFGIASAQTNKMDPPTAVTSPGTPPIENATQQINREHSRNGAPTPLLSTPPAPASNTPASPQPKMYNPLDGKSSPYPGQTLAYPEAPKAMQPGTVITNEEPTGTNNKTVTMPASNTTNQGKVP